MGKFLEFCPISCPFQTGISDCCTVYLPMGMPFFPHGLATYQWNSIEGTTEIMPGLTRTGKGNMGAQFTLLGSYLNQDFGKLSETSISQRINFLPDLSTGTRLPVEPGLLLGAAIGAVNEYIHPSLIAIG